MVAVRWRWRVRGQHHVGGAGLRRVRGVRHGERGGVTGRHPVHAEALHASWLLGNYTEQRKDIDRLHANFH